MYPEHKHLECPDCHLRGIYGRDGPAPFVNFAKHQELFDELKARSHALDQMCRAAMQQLKSGSAADRRSDYPFGSIKFLPGIDKVASPSDLQGTPRPLEGRSIDVLDSDEESVGGRFIDDDRALDDPPDGEFSDEESEPSTNEILAPMLRPQTSRLFSVHRLAGGDL